MKRYVALAFAFFAIQQTQCMDVGNPTEDYTAMVNNLQITIQEIKQYSEYNKDIINIVQNLEPVCQTLGILGNENNINNPSILNKIYKIKTNTINSILSITKIKNSYKSHSCHDRDHPTFLQNINNLEGILTPIFNTASTLCKNHINPLYESQKIELDAIINNHQFFLYNMYFRNIYPYNPECHLNKMNMSLRKLIGEILDFYQINKFTKLYQSATSYRMSFEEVVLYFKNTSYTYRTLINKINLLNNSSNPINLSIYDENNKIKALRALIDQYNIIKMSINNENEYNNTHNISPIYKGKIASRFKQLDLNTNGKINYIENEILNMQNNLKKIQK